MKYVYGPVPSRRLGRSLGISPIPAKTCNYTCVYCQLGKTTNYTNKREMFFPVEEIIAELNTALSLDKEIDYLTIVGEGEPTLYEGLGELIREIRKTSALPIAVITNGALLYEEDVRKDLLDADVVMPTLDASTEYTFRKINRPHRDITLEKVVDGLKKFKQIYKGQIWIEVMLVKNINDDIESLEALNAMIKQIEPKKVYINVPIRPPAEDWVKIPQSLQLITAQEILEAESIAHFEDLLIESVDRSAETEDQILQIVTRHPLRDEQIVMLFPDINETELMNILKKMEEEKLIVSSIYNTKRFWKALIE